MNERLREVMKKGAVLLAAGCAYFVLYMTTGLGLPCVFHEVTGLDCPGCGVSRMLVSLLRLDFAAAWGYNAVLLCMLPVLLALLIGSIVRYVRTGSRKMTRFENILIWALVIILLAWGVLRNL